MKRFDYEKNTLDDFLTGDYYLPVRLSEIEKRPCNEYLYHIMHRFPNDQEFDPIQLIMDVKLKNILSEATFAMVEYFCREDIEWFLCFHKKSGFIDECDFMQVLCKRIGIYNEEVKKQIYEAYNLGEMPF